MDSLESEIQKLADVEMQVPLASMTTLRIGGPAQYVIYPHSSNELEGVMTILEHHQVPFKVLGKGSNLLCSDRPYGGAIIKLDRYFISSYFDGDLLIAEAGCSIIAIAHEAMKNGRSGLEFSSGIPATVGGVVYMNAGAYKASMSDVIEKVQVYRNHRVEWITNEECRFSYRTSIFQKHPEWVIMAAAFRLDKAEPEKIRAVMDDRRERRLKTQPLDMPSAGSVFRNPESIPAWKLIEGAGYRGYRKGDAMVSEKHGNFIVNTGHANGQDFLDLAQEIQQKVKEKYGIDLVMEVEKFNWR